METLTPESSVNNQRTHGVSAQPERTTTQGRGRRGRRRARRGRRRGEVRHGPVAG